MTEKKDPWAWTRESERLKAFKLYRPTEAEFKNMFLGQYEYRQMTPHEILTREIQKIPNIRLPVSQAVVERIFRELQENGYAVVERGNTTCSCSKSSPPS